MTIEDINCITPTVGDIFGIDSGEVEGREDLILRTASQISPAQICDLETARKELPHVAWASLRYVLFRFQGNQDLSQLHRDAAGRLAEQLGMMEIRRRKRQATRRCREVRVRVVFEAAAFLRLLCTVLCRSKRSSLSATGYKAVTTRGR